MMNKSASLKPLASRQSVYAHLRHFLSRTFTLKSTYVDPDEQLQRDLGLNEWEFLEAVVYLETLFDLTLPDETLQPTLTVEQLCSLIRQHKPAHMESIPRQSRQAAA